MNEEGEADWVGNWQDDYGASLAWLLLSRSWGMNDAGVSMGREAKEGMREGVGGFGWTGKGSFRLRAEFWGRGRQLF